MRLLRVLAGLRRVGCALLLLLAAGAAAASDAAAADAANERPRMLAAALDPGPLRERLMACAREPLQRTAFSIGHRGAPFAYPEHTRESYEAAAAQGAGLVECDLSFTADGEPVCRHSQCDLQSSTNILQTPLASTCRVPFTPADAKTGQPAQAQCCVSDITLAQFRTLCGRRDLPDAAATTVDAYLAGAGELCGTLMTHRESIALFDRLGVDMVPELKQLQVPVAAGAASTGASSAGAAHGRDIPLAAMTRADMARRLVQDYLDAGIAPGRVSPQSYLLDDIRVWLRDYPAFGARAVFLDGRIETEPGFDPRDASTWRPDMAGLKAAGVRTLAPPIPVLLTLDAEGRIVPSPYALAARAAGFRLVTWTLERSGPLAAGGGFYYASIRPAIRGDGDVYRVLDVLVQQVGISAIFSDWPATTTLYGNCMGLPRD